MFQNPLEIQPEFKNLIQRMLEYNSDERILIEGIKKHSWYNEAVPTHQEVVEEFKTIINEINRVRYERI